MMFDAAAAAFAAAAAVSRFQRHADFSPPMSPGITPCLMPPPFRC